MIDLANRLSKEGQNKIESPSSEKLPGAVAQLQLLLEKERGLLEDMREIAGTTIEVFRSKEGMRLAAEYRELFNYRRKGQPTGETGGERRSKRANDLIDEMKALVLERINEKSPELAKTIKKYPWG
jgi:hypothetical protein